MDNIFNRILNRIRQKDILIQMILLNSCIFVLINAIKIITKLFKIHSVDIIQYVAVPANLSNLGNHFWTVFTYMFVHENLLHIFFNMILLYWFGQIFLTYFNQKNLFSLYILGGLAGAGLYILAFNTIPYYIDMQQHSIMIGASASVMSIIFAVAFYNPHLRINLLFLGSIKILYIAIVIFILDFISLSDGSNAGGHIAHIGGAIVGYIYAKQYLRGKNITSWLNKVIDSIVNLFKRKPKMKVKYKRAETDYEYNQRKHKESEDIDTILDKVLKSGYSSLTEEEKKRLFDASKK